MRKLMLLASLFPCALVNAQSGPGSRDDYTLAAQYKERVEQEMFLKHSAGVDPAKKEAAIRDAEYRRDLFFKKASKFVTLWTNFAEELNDRKTFNAKLAKEVSKAFHDLETSEGWPVRADKAAK